MKLTSQFRYAILAGLVSSAMLFSAAPSGAEEITIPNHSFETPSAKNGGWYWESELPASENFVWKNNLGEYGLAGKGANHYSAAADGVQAVVLGRGCFISQTLCPTAPDTIYTLSFSILQSKHRPGPESAVKAEIFDGNLLLATQIFTVPAETDVWETVTLAGEPVHAPTGELTIKLTGIIAGETGIGPWIDNITLTAAAAPAGAAGR